ncbi:hypothetical protein GQ53DRAFT_842479 [Thozetella sp. PMI_491]|nr:hypothetical protein GQ53DRAFT_842479 [Thozetella sp. PMI_491]
MSENPASPQPQLNSSKFRAKLEKAVLDGKVRINQKIPNWVLDKCEDFIKNVNSLRNADRLEKLDSNEFTFLSISMTRTLLEQLIEGELDYFRYLIRKHRILCLHKNDLQRRLSLYLEKHGGKAPSIFEKTIKNLGAALRKRRHDESQDDATSTTYETEPSSKRPKQNTPRDLLDAFLGMADGADGPLRPLALAFKEAIRRANACNSGISTSTSSIWGEFGLKPPMALSAKELWTEKAQDDEFMDDLIEKYERGTTNIYRRGQPHTPNTSATLYTVIKQLSVPNPTETFYATNLVGGQSQMQIPERLRGSTAYSDDLMVTTNLTPQCTFVDLHVDHGKHVVTAVHGGCVKLWALYPWTNHNRKVYEKHAGEHDMFIRLHTLLEHGEFPLTEDGEALYLTAGCLHATYTLQGGPTSGIEYTTKECINYTFPVLQVDLRVFGSDEDSSRPFLESIIMAARSEDTKDKAAKFFCVMYPKITGAAGKTAIFAEAKQALRREESGNQDCGSCGKKWQSHKP